MLSCNCKQVKNYTEICLCIISFIFVIFVFLKWSWLLLAIKRVCFDWRWQLFSHRLLVKCFLKMCRESASRVILLHFVHLDCLLHETHLKRMTQSKEKSRQRLVYVSCVHLFASSVLSWRNIYRVLMPHLIFLLNNESYHYYHLKRN